MSDPLERAVALIGEAGDERDALRHRLSVAQAEIHQLGRRVERAEAAYKEVDELNRQLKGLLEAAVARAERSERATRDHVART